MKIFNSATAALASSPAPKGFSSPSRLILTTWSRQPQTEPQSLAVICLEGKEHHVLGPGGQQLQGIKSLGESTGWPLSVPRETLGLWDSSICVCGKTMCSSWQLFPIKQSTSCSPAIRWTMMASTCYWMLPLAKAWCVSLLRNSWRETGYNTLLKVTRSATLLNPIVSSQFSMPWPFSSLSHNPSFSFPSNTPGFQEMMLACHMSLLPLMPP